MGFCRTLKAVVVMCFFLERENYERERESVCEEENKRKRCNTHAHKKHTKHVEAPNWKKMKKKEQQHK